MSRVDLDDPRVWSALARELDSTFGLLTASDRMLRDLRHQALDLDPFFACFSTGAERLLKVVHGLATYERTGDWPSSNEMTKTLSHAITDLDALCRQHVLDALPLATHRPYIEQLLHEVEQQSALDPMLASATRYASNGRFYNLDVLSEKPPTLPSPLELWERMVRDLQDARPEVYTLLGHPGGYEQALREIKREIRGAIHAWWTLYVRAGMHGCFGDRGRRWLSTRTPPAPNAS